MSKLPVHPTPAGISYRLWPGLVVQSKDGLREPARVIRHWSSRSPRGTSSRFVAFGYDMDKMKARAWVEADRHRDFLWREMDTGVYLILSTRQPQDRHGLFDIAEPKPFTPALESGDRLRFSLRPTR